MHVRPVATAYRVSPWFLFWLLAGLAVNVPAGYGDDETPVVVLGVLGILHSVIVFWCDGARRITAPGIVALAAGLFAFFPAVSIHFSDPIEHGAASFLPAVNLVFWVQVVLYYFFWQPRALNDAPVISTPDRAITTWGIWAGLILVLVGFLLTSTSLSEAGLNDGAAFAGITLLAISSFRRDRRITLWAYILIGAAFLVYLEFIFAGFGRLQIGALGIAIAVAATHRWRGHTVKAALLVALPFVLAYLAASRVAFTGALNPGQSASVTGLESVISPFVRFAELLHMDSASELQYSWGGSFFAALTALIPRSVWPDKPVGFGADLVAVFRPDLLGTGHSELALFHGEWLFAFGFLGLLIMIPVMGWLVRALDQALIRVGSMRLITRGSLLRSVVLVILAVSLTDLFWGGAFTYVSRVGPRLIALAPLLLLFGWAPREKPSNPRPGMGARGGRSWPLGIGVVGEQPKREPAPDHLVSRVVSS